jgi:hypothetical protein
MKKMCSLSRFVVFIALLSASGVLRAEDAPTPPVNAAASQNPADTPAAPAPVVAPPTVVASPAPATTAVTPASPTDTLPTTIEPRPEYGQFAGTINFPPSVDLANVASIFTQAATGRGWTIISQANGKLVITNQKGKWNCQLTFLWTPNKLVIYSNSTRGDKPSVPKSWVDNLTKDINHAINPTVVAASKKRSK